MDITQKIAAMKCFEQGEKERRRPQKDPDRTALDFADVCALIDMDGGGGLFFEAALAEDELEKRKKDQTVAEAKK